MDRARLHRWAQRWQVRFTGTVAGGLGVVVTLAAAAAPSPPRGPVTQLGGVLFGVSAASPSAAWAVGDNFAGGASSTVLLHWNGRNWTTGAPPDPGTLWGLSSLSPDNAWAVGELEHIGPGTVFETLVLHWNGKNWTRVPSPSPGPAPVSDHLASVSALSPTDAWAVGDFQNFGPGPVFQTLVLHWNGKKWALAASPNPSRQFDTLYGVSVLSLSDAWAVGVSGKGSNSSQALVLHWNGTDWTQVPSPSPDASRLVSVAVLSPTDAWAVGEHITSAGVHKTLVLHWNGTAWALVPSPDPSPSESQLSSVTALSPSDVWAVGDLITSAGVHKTLVLHWNGTAWAVVPSPSPAGLLGSNLIAVDALAPDDVWATGNVLERGGNDRTLVLHWNGKSWTRS
ncbi:MAG TPA: hypothetical protein VGS19_07410 [Streptosporangiaceae bacterium]|nr:hypothetical protein [Streptosporangiaceae bacterium]